MSIKYYNQFDGERHVREYNTENGVRPFRGGSSHTDCVIYNNTLIVNELFGTIADALKGWGEYSEGSVKLPDGTEVTPLMHFHPDSMDNILTPYRPGTVGYLFGIIPEIM